MTIGFPETLTEEALDTGSLRRMSDLAHDIFGLRFIVVYPKKEGWGQVGIRKAAHRPPFCRLIQGSAEGRDRCAMFHVLLNASACGGKPACQQCHAGAHSIVCPVDTDGAEPIAVVSTCFRPADSETPMPAAITQTGEQLHLDTKKLRSAHKQLPAMTPGQIDNAKALMDSVAEVVGQIRRDCMVRQLVCQASSSSEDGNTEDTRDHLKAALEMAAPASEATTRRRRRQRKKKTPSLPEVIAYIASHKPEMDYSLDEIAAAAGVTANHLSTQFHKAIGKKFSAFLLEERIGYAKDLLEKSDMAIAKIAEASGYDDASYFTRRFRQATGMTPRAWKTKHKGS